MRTLFIIWIHFSVISVYSQELLIMGKAFSTVNFEDTTEFKYITIDTNNIWKIVEPDKQILFLPSTHPYLGKHAIISDTNRFYTNNINASFQFRLLLLEGNSYSISFSHKYDFEKNKDGGTIETSYDNGITWQNILFDTIIQNNLEDTFNFYSPEDLISSFQDQPGFTGLQSEIELVNIVFTALESIRDSTLLLKFTIKTDSANAQNEGWMLDNFRFSGIEVYINESSVNKMDFFIYPNPSKNIIIVCSPTETINRLEIISLTGEKVMEKLNTSSIDLTGISNGNYLVRINNKYLKKLIIK